MSYQIDQSGKIEQTATNTIIAYSNGTSRAMLIPGRLKRKVQEVFRIHGFTSLFIYYLFAVGIFYLLENLTEKAEITVDTEYPGKDKIIKAFIDNLLETNKRPDHKISFVRIGNHPKAHYAAKDVFDKKLIPNKVLSVADVVKALKKTDGRLRECLSTLVDVQARSLVKRYHKKSKNSTNKMRKS